MNDIRSVPDHFAGPLRDAMELYEIDTPLRIVAFLAQVAHESAGFTRLTEDLNYSPGRLLAVFGKRFTPAESIDFAHDDVRIAERVYGGRNGNGPEGSGDGYRYRGRGFLMLTGRANYRATGKRIRELLEEDPDRAAIPEVAAVVAADYWAFNGCNELADAEKYEAITRAINGGMNGYDDRMAWQAKILNEWRV